MGGGEILHISHRNDLGSVFHLQSAGSCWGQGQVEREQEWGQRGTASLQAAEWGYWMHGRGQREPQAAREAVREGGRLEMTARRTGLVLRWSGVPAFTHSIDLAEPRTT